MTRNPTRSRIIEDYLEGRRERDAEVEAALRAEELADPEYQVRQAKLERETRVRIALEKQRRVDQIAHERSQVAVWRLIYIMVLGAPAYGMARYVIHKHNFDLGVLALMLAGLGIMAAWNAGAERERAGFGSLVYVAVLLMIGLIASW